MNDGPNLTGGRPTPAVAPEQARARIAGIEFQLPERRVSNEELAREHPDWRMPEVEKKTGVLARRICAPTETALDLAETACRRLLERLAVARDSVDALVFCTQSPDYVMPPNACLLQHRLGLPARVAAFDYTLACSGYVYGLWLADSLVRSGACGRVLLATGDSYSRYLHPDDRSTVTLFGDGAAATLIERSGGDKAGIGHFVLGTDGGRAERFMIRAGGARVPHVPGPAEDPRQSPNHICMDGPGVMAFVHERVPTAVNQLLVDTGMTMNEVDLVIFHQASQLSLDYLIKWLRIPEAKVFLDLAEVGNTVSASIPVTLRDAELAGRLRPGMKVLLVSFGVGLSWGVCLVIW
jgi:3-oxoacyl-[acyl-carrier-protein] synthase III